MDLRQLEMFEAVAEELSFTRASARLFAAQSTVSAAIRSLEREIGGPLFERSTRRVALTPLGESALADARDALGAADRMRSRAAETSAGLRGRVRVGTITNVGDLGLPALFGAFHRTHPLVTLQLVTSPTGSTGLLDHLGHGRLDVAFVGLPEADLVGLERIVLVRTPFVALVPDGHALAGRRAVRLADLAGEPFVDTPQGYGHRVVLDRAFAAAELTRVVRAEVPDLATVPEYVRAGLGIAVVPRMSSVRAPELQVIAVEPQLTWTLHAVAQRGARTQPATARLLDLLGEHAVTIGD